MKWPARGSDPGASLRGGYLAVFALLLFFGGVAYFSGLQNAETIYRWGEPVGSSLTERGMKLEFFGNILVTFATTTLFPILSLAAWKTSKWKCARALNSLGQKTPIPCSAEQLVGSVRGWSGFWKFAAAISGLTAVIFSIMPFAGSATPPEAAYYVIPSCIINILFFVLCAFVLDEQSKAAESTADKMRIALRGDIKKWRDAQIGKMIDEMCGIPEKGFIIGKYPVTQAQWEAVTGKRPSYFSGDELPVETISYEDCLHFVQRLNELPLVRNTGMKFKLPTEEEWQFACGDVSKGEDIDAIAWHAYNSGDATHPVGQKKPNAFGLFDMIGNVWEVTSTERDGGIVACGGSWSTTIATDEPMRNIVFQNQSGYRTGFRLCADKPSRPLSGNK